MMMSRTYRSIWKDRHYFKHPPKEWRKKEQRSFRMQEKQYFNRFKEHLRKSKDRGYTTW